MNGPTLVAAIVLLALERLAYVAISRWPGALDQWCVRLAPRLDRVDAVLGLFVLFKLLQGTVFLGWHLVHGPVPEESVDPLVAWLGAACIVVGQFLNVAVFQRLGRIGVFYGDRFGHDVPWCTAFPFSWLSHPQYAGAVLTIWGLFLMVRYPAPDWVVLPLVETAYYVIGSYLEGPKRDWVEDATTAVPPAR